MILGSATPDVISYNRADRGDYRLLSMTARVRHPGTPRSDGPLRFLACRRCKSWICARNSRRGTGACSAAPCRPRCRRLAAPPTGDPFLNRRGYATFVNCRDCGYVVKCVRCDLPFTYHSHEERLHCHRCDARAPVPHLCPKCGSWRIRYFGLGTQKVEQEVRTLVPEARVERYDRDVAVGKIGHEVILDRFARGDIDILIGTQIVAKGLDFPRVTLVGAISADTSINLPDFRASERTFALLTQVAGAPAAQACPAPWWCRPIRPGTSPFRLRPTMTITDSTAMKSASAAKRTIPPSANWFVLSIVHRLNRSPGRSALAARLMLWTADHSEPAIEVIGPAPCFTGKADNRYFWQILLRGANVHPILGEVPRPWLIDVDPVNLL